MTARSAHVVLALFLAGSFILSGCAGGEGDEMGADTTGTDTLGVTGMPESATARLMPTQGNTVTGTVAFTSLGEGARIEADVTRLSPGQHGFHVHENGDCSAPDASSAGGHFNPTGAPHGAPDDSARHVGDLGNLEAGSDSTATYSRVDTMATLNGPNSVVGKAVIVHADADDLTSQPSGNAGARVACGVIELDGPGGMMPPGGV